jgi:hypothetical protein
MDRRRYLLLSGSALTAPLAGCSGGSDPDGPGDGGGDDGGDTGGSDGNNSGDGESEATLPQPEISAESISPDNPDSTLDASWTATVFDALRQEGEDQFWEADEGEQYLILTLELTNVGDAALDISPGEFTVTADGTEGEWTVLTDGSQLDVSLDPEESASGSMAFTIPADPETVTISASPVGGAYAVEFERDEELESGYVPASVST